MSEVSPFWRRVRDRMREIAIQLYIEDHRHLEVYNTPEESELREGSYMDRARVLAIREVSLKEPNLPTLKKIKKFKEGISLS